MPPGRRYEGLERAVLDGGRRSGLVSRRGLARLLTACAVLIGLFLMHGAPATAAEGCHGAMPAPASAHAMTGAALPPVAPPTTPAHVTQGSQSHGTQCVSTAARDRIPLPAAGLPAVLAVAAPAACWPAGRPVGRGEARRRGPPGAGRGLLLQVCVART
jgi:hypothetical protein